jgi:serine/threonine protein kinase
MTPERWQQVEQIYHAALEAQPAARSAFLDEACKGDSELRREVASLLDAHHPDGLFLESNALELAARELADEIQRAAPGQRRGSYVLVSLLGAGGMGEVWRALDPALNRHVAIKILPAQYSRDPDRLRRFEREACAAGMLNHPNILAIYAIGKDNDSPYLVTELLEGATLRNRLESGALPEDKAVEYAGQICQGLDAAHNKGIVHRDLKPENIFITNHGHVKILDFGLAKLFQPSQELPDRLQTDTASGTIVGTPAYMAPEQVRGQAADPRSDIFALGAVLYEMLSGRRAFSAGTSVETMNAILYQHPPQLAGISPLVEQVVWHCLEKEAGERFQSARDLGFQLRLARHPSAQAAAPPATRKRLGFMIPVTAGLALLALLAGAPWQLAHRNAPIHATTLTRLTFDSGLTSDPAFSPDGKLIAYASDRAGEGNLDIWRQQLATGESVRLTNDPSDESEPAFSPDGSKIAFRSERDGGGIYLVSAFGGKPLLIARQGRRPRFSPDGSQVAYWVGGWYLGKVFVMPAAGGSPSPSSPDFASALYPIWSPDGKSLLVLAARDPADIPADAFDWWVVPRDGSPPVKTGTVDVLRRQGIREGRTQISLVAPADWLGDQVFFSAWSNESTNLWRLRLQPRTGKADGLATRVTSGTSVEAKPTVISSGGIAFASLTQDLNIWSLPLDARSAARTSVPRQVTTSAFDAHTSISADGKKLTFISTRSGNPDIWMKDLATGEETALTMTPSVKEEQPEITADGARVCYMVVEDRKWAIYQIQTTGGVPERSCDNCGRPWDWSPDGSKILYLIEEGRKQSGLALGLFDTSTRQKVDYLEHPSYSLSRARFSPDGRWISFVANAGSRSRIVVVPLRGHSSPRQDEWISIAEESTPLEKPRWSRDGSVLYYTSDADGFRCIRAQRLNPATKQPAGPWIPIYHSHSARRSLMNAGIPFLELSAARDQLVFNLGGMTGNVWMAKLEGLN